MIFYLKYGSREEKMFRVFKHVVCLVVLIGASSAGAVTFSAATISSISGPQSVASGDFNLDGKMDLAVLNSFASGSTGSDVRIFIGDGNGGYTANTTTYVVAYNAKSVAADDFNGDGKVDLVVGSYLSATVTILMGDGAGGFTISPTTYTASTTFVTTGDVNGDSKVDIVVPGGFNKAYVLLGDGLGGFAAPVKYVTDPVNAAASPTGVAIADLNGDHYADLIVSNSAANNVGVLQGDGTGFFGMATTYALGNGALPNAVVTGDFNRDGYTDVAVANKGTAFNSISILLNTGTGSLGTPVNTVVGTQPVALVDVDLNQDTYTDLVVSNNGSDNISVLLGDGAGGFTVSTVAVGVSPLGVIATDLNRDTYVDVAVAQQGDNRVSILLNQLGNGYTAPPSGGTTNPTTTVPTTPTTGDTSTGSGGSSGGGCMTTPRISLSVLAMMLGLFGIMRQRA